MALGGTRANWFRRATTGARSDDSDDFASFTAGFRQLRVQLVEKFREFLVRRPTFREFDSLHHRCPNCIVTTWPGTGIGNRPAQMAFERMAWR
jgi:hypothetical protein